MLNLIAISLVTLIGDPATTETDREVFDAMVGRHGWNTARLLVHEDEQDYKDEWLEFHWRWNLLHLGETLEESLEMTQLTLDDLWKAQDDDLAKFAFLEFPLLAQLGYVPGHDKVTLLEALDPDQNREFELTVEIRNGREIIPIDSIEIIEDSVVFGFGHYGSRIEASLDRRIGGRSGVLNGEWIKERGDESASRVRFESWIPIKGGGAYCPVNGMPLSNEVSNQVQGRWSVTFEESGSAIGEFELISIPGEMESSRILGTFLTPTGDFRYLGGWVRERDGRDQLPYFHMSVFDGAHAFLFTTKMQKDGTLKGDFYSGNWHHETWTAVRDDDAKLPDAFEQTVIADEAALAEAVFKDLEGEPTRVLDVLDESNAKARIIEIFGTWCPNCSDAGRELVSLKEQYGDDLEIVGLAFEITEDFDRSVAQVRRHHEHIRSDWPILIAGLSDKDKATAALGFLDQVRSYPTLVFLNEANEVQAVYSGFSGPATGDAYIEQRERFEALIDGMIEE